MLGLLVAFSYGGELPTTIVYLLENAKDHEKTRINAFIVAFDMLAVTLSLVVTALCVALLSEQQMIDFGWRLPLLFGALNIFVGYCIRKNIMETTHVVSHFTQHIDIYLVLKLVLRFAPNTVLFFINTIAATSLVNHLTDDPSLRIYLPIGLTLLTCGLCLLSAYLIDLKGNSKAVLTKTYFGMTLLAVPVYALQSLESWPAIMLSQGLILIVTGIIMACVFSDMYSEIPTEPKIAMLGLSINIGMIVLGTTAPLIANLLGQHYGQAYVGLLMSFGGLLFFLSLRLDKLTAKRTMHQKAIS